MPDTFSGLYMDQWLEIALAACDHAGLEVGSIKTLVTWDQEYCANTIYQLNSKDYLKIFGPGAERQFYIERAILQVLQDHLVIPAPRILAAGDPLQSQPYLILAGVPGRTAEEIWDELTATSQLAVARDLGKITAAIHQLPQDELAAVETQFGGRFEHTQAWKDRRIKEIESDETLTSEQRDDLLNFLHQEAWEHLDKKLNPVHYDLAHNHIYLARDTHRWKVSAIIDWAEALLGPPEWDIVYLWHWTFTTKKNRYPEAMQTCLQAYFDGRQPPDRFARRCLSALLYTSSMSLLWPQFAAKAGDIKDIVREMTEFFYPPELFGPPD